MRDVLSKPNIIEAARFARDAHKGQVRKYTAAAYITHPARVATRVMLRDDTDDAMVCAAWLHDTIEDCGVKPEDLAELFGDAVAGLVVAMTNTSKTTGGNRADRKAQDRRRLAECGWDTKLIKLIDRIDNLHEITHGDDFAKVYAAESRLLVQEALAGVDDALFAELMLACDALESHP